MHSNISEKIFLCHLRHLRFMQIQSKWGEYYRNFIFCLSSLLLINYLNLGYIYFPIYHKMETSTLLTRFVAKANRLEDYEYDLIESQDAEIGDPVDNIVRKYCAKGGVLKFIKYCLLEALKGTSITIENFTIKLELHQIGAMRCLSYLVCDTTMLPKSSFRFTTVGEEQFYQFQLRPQRDKILRVSRGTPPSTTPAVSAHQDLNQLALQCQLAHF